MGFQLQEVLRKAGEAVREVYCFERNRWHRENEGKETYWGRALIPRYDGGTDERGSRHQNVWVKIAHFALTNRLEPVRFVRAQFALRMAHPPEPNKLIGERAKDICQAIQGDEVRECSRIFDAQKERMVTEIKKLSVCRGREWTTAQVYGVALSNHLLCLSALFRYCVGSREGFEHLCLRFQQEALEQYMEYPQVYNQVWGDWIPADIKQAAAGLLAIKDPCQVEGQMPAGHSGRYERELILVD